MVEITLSPTRVRGPEGKFDWANVLVDSGIIAGLSFVTNLGGLFTISSATGFGIPIHVALIGAGLQAAIQFFLFLAIKRGLSTTPARPPSAPPGQPGR